MNKSILWILVYLSVFSCTQNKDVAGGSATETTNGISISVVLRDGSVGRYAQATLCPSSYTKQSSMNTCLVTQTDSTGLAHFEPKLTGNWIVEVRDSTGAIWMQVLTDSLNKHYDLGIDTLQRFARLHGIAPLGTPVGTPVYLLGSQRFALVNEIGQFTFDSLAPGKHIIEINYQDSMYRGYGALGSGSVASTGILQVESNAEILFENFEDDDSRHRLAALSGEGWWYVSSRVGVNLIPNTLPIPVDTTDSIHHHAIHFQVQVDSGISYPWANCGVQLGIRDMNYNLSSVDSIAFWAKGKGPLAFAISVDPTFVTIKSVGVSIPLDTVWKRIVIPLDTIPLADSLSIEQVLQYSRAFVWQFSQEGELWLDDISLIGADREEIWGR